MRSTSVNALTYCKTCLIAIATEEEPEDRERLDHLASYDLRGKFQHAQGLCGRCGLHGNVIYLSAEP